MGTPQPGQISGQGGCWVSPQPGQILGQGGGAGTPPPQPGQISGWGEWVRSDLRMGGAWVPPQARSDPRTGGGVPHWNSIACTCYAAGGMPLAFTQEDFLVYFNYLFKCNMQWIKGYLSFGLFFDVKMTFENRYACTSIQKLPPPGQVTNEQSGK